jgi:glutaredoxin
MVDEWSSFLLSEGKKEEARGLQPTRKPEKQVLCPGENTAIFIHSDRIYFSDLSGRDTVGRELVILCTAIILGLVPAAGQAAVYKWVDENGVVTFKDTPPPTGVKSDIVTPDNSLVGDSGANGAGIGKPGGKGKTFAGVKTFPGVEIFMAEWCPSCKAAIKFLNSKGVRYKKYDVDKDRDANVRLTEKYHQKSIPFTIIGDEKILGFNRQRFESALGLDGH